MADPRPTLAVARFAAFAVFAAMTVGTAGEARAEDVRWIEPTHEDSARRQEAASSTAVVLSPILDTHAFVFGDTVKGIATEPGLRIGFSSTERKGSRWGLRLSGIFPTGLFAFGLDVAKDEGIVLFGKGTPTQGYLLAPHLDLRFATDFKDNTLFVPGGSVTGFRVGHCAGAIGFKFDLRLPRFDAWVPIKLAGQSDGSGRIDGGLVSAGVSLEAGVVF